MLPLGLTSVSPLVVAGDKCRHTPAKRIHPLCSVIIFHDRTDEHVKQKIQHRTFRNLHLIDRIRSKYLTERQIPQQIHQLLGKCLVEEVMPVASLHDRLVIGCKSIRRTADQESLDSHDPVLDRIFLQIFHVPFHTPQIELLKLVRRQKTSHLITGAGLLKPGKLRKQLVVA